MRARASRTGVDRSLDGRAADPSGVGTIARDLARDADRVAGRRRIRCDCARQVRRRWWIGERRRRGETRRIARGHGVGRDEHQRQRDLVGEAAGSVRSDLIRLRPGVVAGVRCDGQAVACGPARAGDGDHRPWRVVSLVGRDRRREAGRWHRLHDGDAGCIACGGVRGCRGDGRVEGGGECDQGSCEGAVSGDGRGYGVRGPARGGVGQRHRHGVARHEARAGEVDCRAGRVAQLVGRQRGRAGAAVRRCEGRRRDERRHDQQGHDKPALLPKCSPNLPCALLCLTPHIPSPPLSSRPPEPHPARRDRAGVPGVRVKLEMVS